MIEPIAPPIKTYFCTSVRYGKMAHVAKFKTERQDLKPRDWCLIRTDRGRELGEILAPLEPVPQNIPAESLWDILRKASPEDVTHMERLDRENRVRELTYGKDKIKAYDLPMKLVEVDHLFGGERLIFYFIAPNRVDFRELVRNLAREFRTRIELKQIGARDEARLVGDIGHCGLSLCCRGFLKELGGITMDMAKIQKHTADPSKITGRCGKLLCCLRYEYTAYLEGRDLLPARGARIESRLGPGVVVGQNLILREVTIEKEGGERVVVGLDQIVGAPQRAPGCTGCSKGTGSQATEPLSKELEDTKVLDEAVPLIGPPGEFVKAAKASEMAVGTGKTVDVGGTPIALFNIEGTFYAIHDSCPHQGGPLGEGNLETNVVRCPWHAWRWDVITGKNVDDPAQGVKTFEVMVEGDDVFVKV